MRGLAALVLAACAGPQPLDTSCPEGGASETVLVEMASRGIGAPPDTMRFRFGETEVLVGWKNLLSGRELTLSCAWHRQGGDEWRLLRERLDEGTHALRVSANEDAPALVYRDAGGRLLEVVPVEPLPDGRRTR